jgi:hypothetical protein
MGLFMNPDKPTSGQAFIVGVSWVRKKLVVATVASSASQVAAR